MEKWKVIKGYPKYEVSSLGRIRSYHLCEKGRILKGGLDKDGYRLVLLYNENGRVTRKFHRLVAEAFIPNDDNKLTVNHINNVKDDNKLENLEWATHQENTVHAFREGFRNQDGLVKPVSQIDRATGEVIRVYESITATIKDGFHRQSVGRVCRGERSHHKGYGWRYF